LKIDSCIKDKNCICKKYNSYRNECIDKLTIGEKGKSVSLSIKNDAEALVAIIDKCIITDNKPKCDAIFLYRSNNKKISFLVELKGFGEIKKAFYQLSFTKEREVYKKIIGCFENIDNKKVVQKFIIITNGILNKIQQERYEEIYKIRIKAILTSEATKPIPNLKDLI